MKYGRIHFDTRKFIRKLKESGSDERQSEALIDPIKASHDSTDVTTKQDIGNLHREIRELELRLTGEIKRLKWGMSILIAGVASLILKAFF